MFVKLEQLITVFKWKKSNGESFFAFCRVVVSYLSICVRMSVNVLQPCQLILRI